MVLSSMLIHKNREGLDPYHLALLTKDASAAKLLEEKMSHQACLKSEFEVKEYHIIKEDDEQQLECFNKGFEIEEELN